MIGLNKETNQHLFLSLILFLILNSFGCSNSHNVETDTTENVLIDASGDVVTVTSENDTNGSHMSRGYVFFEKGNNIDTMELGSWGYAPVHKQFKLNDRDYVAFVFSYLDMGDNEKRLSIMSLNEDNYQAFVWDTLFKEQPEGEDDIGKEMGIELCDSGNVIFHHYSVNYGLSSTLLNLRNFDTISYAYKINPNLFKRNIFD
tara:strand:+ start:978 stop:1583 length:606 start_codon:yes stop_codon:yes gene_type:complete